MMHFSKFTKFIIIMSKMIFRLILVGFVTVLSACSVSVPKEDYKPKVDNADYIHRSVKQVTDVIVHDIFSPPVASRIYVYMSVAGYEAAIPEHPKYLSLAGQL